MPGVQPPTFFTGMEEYADEYWAGISVCSSVDMALAGWCLRYL